MQRLIGNLGEIFTPIIPALVAGGLILGFRNCIDSLYLFEQETKPLVDISQFWSGVDSFLWLIGEAIFHYLPVAITWSITRKMGTSQVLGIILGITLVSPQLLNAYAVASTPVADIPVWNFGFATVRMIGYQAQVIPAIMAGFILVYLERFFQKITPAIVSIIVVPFCSIVLAVLIAHTIVGPIGWVLGDWIPKAVYAGLMNPFGWLFAGLFGLLYAPLVITGLHHMSNAIDSQLISSYGGTILWPMIALSNIAQGSAVLGFSFLTRKNERIQQVSLPAAISCYLGVTEPALFGINLKYGFPIICGMIGSSIAAMFSDGFGISAVSIGVGGLPGILSIFPQYWGLFLIAMVIAIVIPFVLTVIWGKTHLSDEVRYGQAQKENRLTLEQADKDVILNAPMRGTLLPLSEIKDQVFASGAMGQGFAIDPEDGLVLAPCNAEVMMVFPTKHAIGLKTQKGEEVLIHLGMDTVELNGEGFTMRVKQGDLVTAGDPMVEMDLNAIRAAGKSVISPVVVTSGQNVKLLADGKVEASEPAAVILPSSSI
ncbi:PTS trehalose transporter subunit IIBC [uncultured Allobaculum sp.]|uniref:PTS trehalose transporter subunit IIBC n=1 Tax=uncultured Allobaculum sp. TaxID=1187017 RepID=UPI00259B4570|nr:PTS trehalose transporter subunit IIBC [uncultured Allobaculum sp.]